MRAEDTTITVALQAAFDGRAVTTLEWDGRPCWGAPEVERAIGLTATGAGSLDVGVARWARRSEDYREGKDGFVATGGSLATLKAAGVVGSNAPEVTVLYESGLTLYLMASRAEAARRFRWWLVDDVLPLLRAARSLAALPAPVERVVGTRAEARMLAAEARERAAAANAEIRKEIAAMKLATRERNAAVLARAREREAEARLATIAERKATREARAARKRRR